LEHNVWRRFVNSFHRRCWRARRRPHEGPVSIPRGSMHRAIGFSPKSLRCGPQRGAAILRDGKKSLLAMEPARVAQRGAEASSSTQLRACICESGARHVQRVRPSLRSPSSCKAPEAGWSTWNRNCNPGKPCRSCNFSRWLQRDGRERGAQTGQGHGLWRPRAHDGSAALVEH